MKLNKITLKPIPKKFLYAIIVIVAGLLLFEVSQKFDLSPSDWAAWVQAIGSIMAILAAFMVIQLSHNKEKAMRDEDERKKRRFQLNTLRWTYISIAEKTEAISKKIGVEHVSWHLESEILNECRNTLLRIPLDYLIESGILVRTHELATKIQIAVPIIQALEKPRKNEIQEHVQSIIKDISVCALTGVTEVTDLLIKCSLESEMESDWSLFNKRDENRKLTLDVLKQLNEAKTKKDKTL